MDYLKDTLKKVEYDGQVWEYGHFRTVDNDFSAFGFRQDGGYLRVTSKYESEIFGRAISLLANREENTMKEFTKEKWQRDGLIIRARGRGIIATIPTPGNGGVFECVANARLIAAAPAMYEALKAAQEGTGDWRAVVDLALAEAEEKL